MGDRLASAAATQTKTALMMDLAEALGYYPGPGRVLDWDELMANIRRLQRSAIAAHVEQGKKTEETRVGTHLRWLANQVDAGNAEMSCVDIAMREAPKDFRNLRPMQAQYTVTVTLKPDPTVWGYGYPVEEDSDE